MESAIKLPDARASWSIDGIHLRGRSFYRVAFHFTRRIHLVKPSVCRLHVLKLTEGFCAATLKITTTSAIITNTNLVNISLHMVLDSL